MSDFSNNKLQIIRHSMAHILAYALKEIDPTCKLAIGPAVSNGFYYDIDSTKTFSTTELLYIEDKMKEIINKKLPFERQVVSRGFAIEFFTKINETYKIELIEEIPYGEDITLYKVGEFVDLCRGPHVSNTSEIDPNSFKLTSVAGAYWRGDSSNKSLQRIYGVAFSSKNELVDHLQKMEEAEKRDHRKLGPELGLFHISEEAPGSVFWLPKGYILFNMIKNFLSEKIKHYGYQQVQTPQILNKSLWETSGHWDKFKENMFILENSEKTVMAVKPMNCPGHIIVYKDGAVKSYRDLPIRYAEFGVCHRNEASGALHGLLRLRAFMQDDGHIFCTPDQIISETKNFCKVLKEVYATFGFYDIAVKFSDRPKKRAGTDEIWDLAEKSLMEAAIASELEFTINPGEGAFYGPKLEFVLKDCLGRNWQCGTLQVDFILPQRFKAMYVDSDGEKKVPVLIHRALVGSLERFIGILTEHYAGKFPFWLSPIQIAVCSITQLSSDYAKEMGEILEELGYRYTIDTENQKISYKVRKYFAEKIPYIIIVGREEIENKTVSIRALGSKDTIQISLSEIPSFFPKSIEK